MRRFLLAVLTVLLSAPLFAADVPMTEIEIFLSALGLLVSCTLTPSRSPLPI